MAGLLPPLTEQDDDPTRQDAEPDLQWKNALRGKIENGLRSVVEKAMLVQEAQFGFHMIDPTENARFAQEHIEIMVNIRCLAKEHYRHALERERQERKWALEWQALLHERQIILEAIEKKADLRWQQGTDYNVNPVAEPQRNGSGIKRTAPQRAQSVRPGWQAGGERAATQSRVDTAPKYNHDYDAPPPIGQDRTHADTSRYQSPTPPKVQAAPLVWRPSLSPSIAPPSSKSPAPPPGHPPPNQTLPEFWRPSTGHVLQSREPDDEDDDDAALTGMLPPSLLQRPPTSAGTRPLAAYKPDPAPTRRVDTERAAGMPLRPASRLAPVPPGPSENSRSPHGRNPGVPTASLRDDALPSPLSLWLQNLQGAGAGAGVGHELDVISSLVASEHPAFASGAGFNEGRGDAEAEGYAEVFTRREAEAGRQQADVQWLKEEARFNPQEARRREQEARQRGQETIQREQEAQRTEDARREEEELQRRDAEVKRKEDEERQREERSRNEEAVGRAAQQKKHEEPARREPAKGKGQAKKARRAQETAKSQEGKGSGSGKSIVVEQETEAQRESLRREREAAMQQEFLRREQEIARRKRALS